MTEQPLRLSLEPIQGQPHQYLLSWQDVGYYPITVRVENNLVLTDLLRAFPELLLGRRKPVWLRVAGDPLKVLGERLWDLLFPVSAPLASRQALAKALRSEMTPVVLHLPAALSHLPWELLADPEQPAGAVGFLARQRPLMRLSEAASPMSPLPFPLKVLVLISSPPALGANARVDVESERTAIMQATSDARKAGRLHLLIEDIVTPQRVQQALIRFRPHLVQYIGHGGYDQATGGVLLWEDDRGEVLPYPAHRLAELLRPRRLRAVLLHACETASGHGTLDLPNMAEVLLRASLPAVLAQQANLTYESSVLATRAWYTSIIEGQSLADALFEVRQVLAQTERPDWAVPVLTGSLASLEPFCDVRAPAGEPDPEVIVHRRIDDLPTPIGIFVGRHREMRALHLMLEETPGFGPVLALITGPGGMGKSTLVSQAVTRYGRDYQGTLTLRCAGYQGMDLWLQSLGDFLRQHDAPFVLAQVLPDPQRSIQAKIEAAVAALNQMGPVLLIVDNVESVQAEDRTLRDPDLRFFLQVCLRNLRGSRLLLTGRFPIADLLPEDRFAAHVLHLDLDDLSGYETQRLLMRHPSLRGLEETTHAILRETFGGLPYVYDVLATGAKGQSLDALVHDIQDRITEERERRTAAEWQEVRQRVSEFATLATTADRLSAGSRRALGAISLLQKPFPLEVFEQGLQVARQDWQPLLDWSLVRHDPFTRTYQVHSVTRYHASALVPQEERVTWMDQLAQWYERYADQESHDLGDYLEAHRLWEEAGLTQQAGQLVLQLAPTLHRLGLYQVLRQLCQTTLEDARSAGNELLISPALFWLGRLVQDQGEYEQARGLYEESREICERLGDQSGVSKSLHELGMLAQAQGEYEQARGWYEQSREIKERLGDQSGVSKSLHQLGILAQAQGEYEQARRWYEQSREIFERLGDQSGVSKNLHQLGMLAQDQGEYEQARGWYEQSREILERLGDQSGIASSLHQLGMLAQAQGEYEQARGWYEQSREIKERLGDQSGVSKSLQQLGMLAQAQGEYEQARGLYEQSREIKERLGDQSGIASSLGQLGLLASAQRDFPQALSATVQALRIFRALRSPSARLAEQTLVKIRAAMGEDAFQVHWQAIAPPELALPPQPASQGDDDPIQTMIALLQTPTWDESQRFLEAHPELLTPEMEPIWQALLAGQENENARRSIIQHLHLLARCREIGIAEAYRELTRTTATEETTTEEGED